MDKQKNNKDQKIKWEEKQLYGHFKRQIGEIAHEKTWTWLRKGNLKRETESLIIAAQNNVIRTNYIEAKINETKQNSKCRLCGERDETKPCIKGIQSQARLGWVGDPMGNMQKFQF